MFQAVPEIPATTQVMVEIQRLQLKS